MNTLQNLFGLTPIPNKNVGEYVEMATNDFIAPEGFTNLGSDKVFTYYYNFETGVRFVKYESTKEEIQLWLCPFRVVDSSNAEQFYNNLKGVLSRLEWDYRQHFTIWDNAITYHQDEDTLNTTEHGSAVFFIKGEATFPKQNFDLPKEDWSGWFGD